MVPSLYARSIRLSRPCRSARQSPLQAENRLKPPGKRGQRRWCCFFLKKTAAQEMTGCLSGPGVTLGREDAEEEEETDALVFSVVRSRGEERKIGGNITLASPPSRRFLTRPHCVLLPLSPAPTSSAPDCCSGCFLLLNAH